MGWLTQMGVAGSVARRESRVVVDPDFQGLGLGWRLSEAVAADCLRAGYRYRSITAHPTLGGGRDRSPRWMPTGLNHKADKHEAIADSSSRHEAGFVRKEREVPRPGRCLVDISLDLGHEFTTVHDLEGLSRDMGTPRPVDGILFSS